MTHQSHQWYVVYALFFLNELFPCKGSSPSEQNESVRKFSFVSICIFFISENAYQISIKFSTGNLHYLIDRMSTFRRHMLPSSFALKMKAKDSIETLVPIYESTRHHKAVACIMNTHICENDETQSRTA